MNPACELCKGACCETFGLKIGRGNPDFRLWVSLHGEETDSGIRFECPCTMLKNGKCAIYEDRPKVCRNYPVGNKYCLESIDTRRKDIAHKIKELIDGTPEEG